MNRAGSACAASIRDRSWWSSVPEVTDLSISIR
jgi:hypothetical protein